MNRKVGNEKKKLCKVIFVDGASLDSLFLFDRVKSKQKFSQRAQIATNQRLQFLLNLIESRSIWVFLSQFLAYHCKWPHNSATYFRCIILYNTFKFLFLHYTYCFLFLFLRKFHLWFNLLFSYFMLLITRPIFRYVHNRCLPQPCSHHQVISL